MIRRACVMAALSSGCTTMEYTVPTFLRAELGVDTGAPDSLVTADVVLQISGGDVDHELELARVWMWRDAPEGLHQVDLPLSTAAQSISLPAHRTITIRLANHGLRNADAIAWCDATFDVAAVLAVHADSAEVQTLPASLTIVCT